MTTKRVESLRAPCLDASSTLATSTKKRRTKIRLFFVEVGGFATPPYVTHPLNPPPVRGTHLQAIAVRLWVCEMDGCIEQGR